LSIGKLCLFAAISKQSDDSTIAEYGLLLATGTDIPGMKFEVSAGNLRDAFLGILECLIRKNNLLASIRKMLFYLTIWKFND
jgi:hypothetical protein